LGKPEIRKPGVAAPPALMSRIMRKEWRSGPQKKGPHADLDGGSSGLRQKPRRTQPVL
jgi:hypothetical protein